MERGDRGGRRRGSAEQRRVYTCRCCGEVVALRRGDYDATRSWSKRRALRMSARMGVCLGCYVAHWSEVLEKVNAEYLQSRVGGSEGVAGDSQEVVV